jgi:hypothetical protein
MKSKWKKLLKQHRLKPGEFVRWALHFYNTQHHHQIGQ